MRTVTLTLGLFVVCTLQLFAQTTFCTYQCGNAIQDCHSCDVANDLTGTYPAMVFPFGSATAPPATMCDGWVPNYLIWYAFTAGSENISITATRDCSTGGGVQLGLKGSCNGSNCIAIDGDCNTNTVEISASNLVIGEVYYIFIDPCSGEACAELEIEVTEMEAFELDEPYSISARRECSTAFGCLTADLCEEEYVADCTITEIITVCPGELITFRGRHQGNSITDYGDYDAPCSFYPQELQAESIWYFDGQEYESEWVGITFEMPMVSEEYITELCLSSIIKDGCSSTNDEVCIVIKVLPLEPEIYSFNICSEDLSDDWEVPLGLDPNGDGQEWGGPEKVDLYNLLQEPDGCKSFSFGGECGCLISQVLCIQEQGNSNPSEAMELYMYDCQFDEDGEYEWIWEEDDYELTRNVTDQLITISEGSFLEDWDEERCDTTMRISVNVYDVQGALSQQDCGEDNGIGWALYEFELDLDFLEDEAYENWPKIFENRYEVEWIDCETGESLVGYNGVRNYTIEGQDSEACIRVVYEFYDGAWGDRSESPLASLTYCDKTFGPYTLIAGCEEEEQEPNCPSMNNVSIFIDGTELARTDDLSLLNNQTLSLSLNEDLLPDGAVLEWWISDQSDFIPKQEGTRLRSTTISSTWQENVQEPELLAISYRDPFDRSEYFVVASGSGFAIDNFYIDLDENCDATCPVDCITELYGTQCPWKKSNKIVLSDCPNVIPVGPGDHVPPNSILIVYVDEDEENLIRSAESLCSEDDCIYVLFNECDRCLDAFADEGSASYTITTGPGSTSTLSYVADPDGGSVNNNGEYAYERDSLPSANFTRYEITATANSTSFTLPCSEFPGQQYIRGVIVSDLFPTDCCNPYTRTISVELECEEVPPPSGGDEIFEDFPWLTTLVDSTDCDGITITVYAQGVYNFIHVETATSGTLYFQDGTRYCTDSASFSCVTAYGFGAPVDTWTCDDGGGNPPGPGGDPEVFTDFPFLTALVDVDDCEGTTVSVYAQGVYNFIHIQTVASGILYFQDGTLYCTDSPGFSCVTAYGFGAPTSVWECGDGVGDPPVGPNFLPDFPWLEDVVDLSDCSGTSVFVYESGVYSYIFVEENGLMTMYNGAGQFYCQDAPGFSCLSAYGFTSADLTDEWTCVQLVGEIPTESREAVVQKLIVNVYPNPSNGIFNLDVNVEEYSLEVFDLNGKSYGIKQNTALDARVDLTKYPVGIYLIKIATDIDYVVHRILIVK